MRTRSQGPSSSDKTRNPWENVEGEIRMYHVARYPVTRNSVRLSLLISDYKIYQVVQDKQKSYNHFSEKLNVI